MTPAVKRFMREYGPIADAVASAPVEQTARETVAEWLRAALLGRRDFNPDLFRALATDPLVDCAGPRGEPLARCPHDRRIRIAMHDSGADDGRAQTWAMHPPEVRCVSCGAPAHLNRTETTS